VLQKRRGDFEQAIPLWEQAAADGHVYAYVELAKFHEHRRRDPGAALQWTKSALKQLKQAGLPSYVRKHWEQELRHRRERLEAKVRKQ
jgi:TPR repeat protein